MSEVPLYGHRRHQISGGRATNSPIQTDPIPVQKCSMQPSEWRPTLGAVRFLIRECRRWSSNPSGKCSYERPTRGTVCGTMRSMCGADAGCLAINYQSLEPAALSCYAGHEFYAQDSSNHYM